MPLLKKKTASKTSKPGGSGSKRAPSAKTGSGSNSRSAGKRAAVSGKPAAVKKVADKKASAKLKTTSANKKVSTSRTGTKSQVKKAVVVKKQDDEIETAQQAVGKKTSSNPPKESSPSVRPSKAKADKNIPKHIDLKMESITEQSRSQAGSVSTSTPAVKPNVVRKKKSHASGPVATLNQSMAKQGQKKRGWRDIEALTERARLKNLLSDIWHEDIDLDSDIFGETDQFSSYYTDKEEEIVVEDDEDEEWEEFEEDES